VIPRATARLHDHDVPELFKLRFPAHWAATPRKSRLATAWERDTLQWLRSFGMGATSKEADRLRKFVCGDYGGCSFPLANYERGLLVTQYISLWLFWDDLQVESELAWDVSEFVAALEGRHALAGASRYVLAWADLGVRLRRSQSEEWLAQLCSTMRQWLDNAKHETAIAQAWARGLAAPSYAEALACRNVSIGMYPTFLLDEFAGGFELSASTRAHPSLQALRHTAAGLVGFGNDLGGIAKDLKSGWLNLVSILAAEDDERLDDAFARVVAQHNADVLTFDRQAAELPSFGEEQDLSLRAWLDAVRHNVFGFTSWESTAQRYQEHVALVGSIPLLAPVTLSSEYPSRARSRP